MYLLGKCLLRASHQPDPCFGLWEQRGNKTDMVPALLDVPQQLQNCLGAALWVWSCEVGDRGRVQLDTGVRNRDLADDKGLPSAFSTI